MNALFDTNILIDYLNGVEQARAELEKYERGFISAITWAEVMVGASDETEAETRAFLRRFEVVAADESVMELAVKLRRTQKLRLPNALIWASAQSRHLLLVTRNTKDFPRDAPGVRIPYQVNHL